MAFFEKWDILGFVVAGLIGAIIMLLIDGFKSVFSMKRKKYCISKSLTAHTVYRQFDQDGLKISISYNNKEIEGPLSILEIRMRNDGEEDLMYSQRISRLCMIVETREVLDVSVESGTDGVNPTVDMVSHGNYEIKWDLLKKDEFFRIKIIVEGEVEDMSCVMFDIRADGINQIKTPEYKVAEVMIPALCAEALVVIPIVLFYPSQELFLNILPMKWLLVGCMIIAALVLWIGALHQRIRWMKEQ